MDNPIGIAVDKEKGMKVEILFLANSIDVDTYEGEHIDWTFLDGQLIIYSGTKEQAKRVATYPEHRVVRVKVV